MKDKYKTNKGEPFTIAYLDILKELNIGYTEYMILNYMIRFSKRNQFKSSIEKLCKYLDISKATFYRTNIINLIERGHIIKEDKFYYLNYDISEIMNCKNGKYIIIYHNRKKWIQECENRIITINDIKQYVFLYLIYSLSKNTINKTAIVGRKYIKNITTIQNRNFYTTVEKLQDKGLLTKSLYADSYKLSEELFLCFETVRNGQILHTKN